jgi:S-(hydroxymethyl)glutathione dehydrogenase/alcohol dehydrogenase
VHNPTDGEIRVRMKYATFSVHDSLQHAYSKHSEYPYLAGYDGVGVVDEVGEGVEEFEKGDTVAVFTVPGNHTIKDKSNVSDLHAKFLNKDGLWKASKHLQSYAGVEGMAGFNGLGTWSQLAIFPAAHLTKLDHEPQVSDAGLGSVFATGLISPQALFGVEEGSTVAVFGSNSLGLTLVHGLKDRKASKIVVVGAADDQELFEKLGTTFVVDEGEATDVQAKLMEASADGYDYTFEASNFVRFGTAAVETCHKGWGKAALLTKGKNKDDKISTRPFQLVTGRHWVGTYMGNVNISKHHKELLAAYSTHGKEISDLIFPSDHIVSIDDFPAKWAELSTTATYHRTVIEF